MSIIDELERMPGYPQEQWTSDGEFRATSVYRVDWNSRHAIARQLRGLSIGATTTAVQYPGVPSARVVSISAQPEGELIRGNSVNQNEFEKALLIVEFQTPGIRSGGGSGSMPEQETDGVIVEETIEPRAEFLTLNNQKFFWSPGDITTRIDDAESPARIVRLMEWTLTMRNVIDLPDSIDEYIGRLNSKVIVPLSMPNRTFNAQTLMFSGMTQSRQFTAEGPAAWTCTFKFLYRPYSWNLFFRSGYNSPQFIYGENGNIFDMYLLADFKTLFKLKLQSG